MYSYEREKSKLFTDEGQRLFLKMRDAAFELCKEAGCVRMQEMMRTCDGDTWTMLACADRMVELGELVEIVPASERVAGQHRIFRRPYTL